MDIRHDPTHALRLERLRAVAEAALGRYGLARALPPALINLSENATYRIDDPESGGRFALRVHRDGYHSRNAISSELAWLKALRRDSVVITPVPVPGSDGDIIQTVSHPALPHPRNVVLFQWENGVEPSEADLAGKYALLGELSARMHCHPQSWQRPENFERHSWDFSTSLGDRPLWGSWRDGIGVDRAKERLFADAVRLIGQRLARFGKGPERFGLIHCDMRAANLLVDGDTVKVLDFDDSGFSWHLYDAATAVSFIEHEPQVPELMAAWAEGYRGVRDLPAADEAEIPTFVLLRRLILVAWIGSHSDTDLARSMGAAYTDATVGMCEDYLTRFG
jgi:Ser/Thr protein kinase RdoA (MazF antagonist)